MKNKSLMIVGGVVVLIALIVGGVMLSSKKTTPVSPAPAPIVAPVTPPAPPVEPKAPAATESKSFNEILSAGGVVECAFSSTDDPTTKTSGTLYSGDAMMRGDFQSQTIGGAMMLGHMVLKDGYMYSWVDGMAGGMKFKVDTTKTADSNGADKNNLDVNKKMDITCKPWSVDSAQFVLPTDRQFQDLTSFANPAGVKTEDSNNGAATGTVKPATSQCAVCDSLSGDQKQQCKTALGCK